MVAQRTPKAAKPKRAPIRKRAPAPKRDPKRVPSIAARIIALGKQIPEEDLTNFPTDGAANHDHYIYGSPKRY